MRGGKELNVPQDRFHVCFFLLFLFLPFPSLLPFLLFLLILLQRVPVNNHNCLRYVVYRLLTALSHSDFRPQMRLFQLKPLFLLRPFLKVLLFPLSGKSGPLFLEFLFLLLALLSSVFHASNLGQLLLCGFHELLPRDPRVFPLDLAPRQLIILFLLPHERTRNAVISERVLLTRVPQFLAKNLAHQFRRCFWAQSLLVFPRRTPGPGTISPA
mmetsp:Transcript_24169/g.47518  ORF Transcript_24169/g.47518 Transcript_24169/m.47518 type:complete len:213 (-) Transcript_24169:299-937(-)